MSEAKIVTIKCPLCEKPYPLNQAMLYSAFACMNCGTLIRASAVLQPGSGGVGQPLSRRDTQPISRGDTTQIERPDVSSVPGRQRIPDPLDLEELADESVTDPLGPPRPKRKKSGINLNTATIVAVCGAVAILLIVVIGMLINKSIDNGAPQPLPVVAVPPPVIPIQPAQQPVSETLEQRAERERTNAFHQAERTAAQIERNKAEILRLQTALREATTKHFAGVQKELEEARARGKELVEIEARWRAEYGRLNKLLGK